MKHFHVNLIAEARGKASKLSNAVILYEVASSYFLRRSTIVNSKFDVESSRNSKQDFNFVLGANEAYKSRDSFHKKTRFPIFPFPLLQ